MSAGMRQLTERPSQDDNAQLLYRCGFVGTVGEGLGLERRFRSFLDHYGRELETIRPHRIGKPLAPGQDAVVKTHADLRVCLAELQRDQNATRVHVVHRVRQHYPTATDSELERIVGVCVRVALFLNVREQAQGRLDSLTSFPIQWDSTVRLKELIGRQFPRSRWKLNANESRLHPRFTAAFMVQVCSLKINWTDCLADHLYLDRQNNTLYIFPHKSSLVGLLQHTSWDTRRQPGAAVRTSMPKSVIEETILSLNLLFPHWDNASNELLKAQKQEFQCHPPFSGPRTLNLLEFDVWRDRLLELSDVVFTSTPASIRQLFLDRRNPQQFWTFWIAIVILLLTIISTVASVYQAAKS